jgi:hypothetical protein
MREVSWLAEESFAFKDGLDSKELEFLIYAGEKKKKTAQQPPSSRTEPRIYRIILTQTISLEGRQSLACSEQQGHSVMLTI